MDREYMFRALELARKAEGRTSPNPMVGAVIVKDGNIIGEGYHQKAGGPHAEIFALEAASANTKGATLYVSLEPCNHYGRTPPCTEAIINSGIARVVVAAKDPNPLVAGKGIKRLADAGVEVMHGLLAEEALSLNEVFVKYITTKKPFVVWKTAMTLDGKIATSTGDSRWVTGASAREFVHLLRDKYDAIMVGINTLIADDPLLNTRLKGKEGIDPTRIVVDSHLRFPENAKMLRHKSNKPTIIATTKIDSSSKRKKALVLEQLGIEVWEVGGKDRVDLNILLEWIAQKEYTSLLLEGGSELAASFILQDLVDKVHVFIAPKIIGGREAPGTVGGKGIERMEDALKLKTYTVEKIDEDLMVTGYLK